MQVQYSERDSDHGSNGVGRGGGVVANNGGGVGVLGSRERLAPPSSSSESLGGDLKSTYYILSGQLPSLFDTEKKIGQQAICRQISNDRSSDGGCFLFGIEKRAV